jgi:hypothetical protein
MSDRERLREKIEGYRRVNALEIEELRKSTPEQCWRQLHSLMELAKAMRWEVHKPEEIEAVRRRWQKLKGYGG